MRQRLDEGDGERLSHVECRRTILVEHYPVPGHEAALAVSVDQQRLTQLEALVLSD